MSERKSYGEEVSEIAKELHIPSKTVDTVLRTRLRRQVESLMNGDSITIEGLFSIKALKDCNTGAIALRGSVSPALKTAVNDRNKKLRMLKP